MNSLADLNSTYVVYGDIQHKGLGEPVLTTATVNGSGLQLASGREKKQDSPLHGFNGVFLQKYFTRPDAEMMQHINFVFVSRMFEGGGPTVTKNLVSVTAWDQEQVCS